MLETAVQKTAGNATNDMPDLEIYWKKKKKMNAVDFDQGSFKMTVVIV